jgi:glycosyltransferase involved in cell wall biosynthesis/regulator of replication initiation timing
MEQGQLNAVLPPELPPHDYVSPGMAIVRPDDAFPNMIVGDTSVPRWRWLRRWVEHNWYTDRRNPDAGFLNRDEAAILYNTARLVHGKPCLEIGCWRGWSTVHLALGSGVVDVVDPILAKSDFAESVRRSCESAGVLDAVAFHPGLSPAAVDALGRTSGKRWSLIFVDGDHEGDAPRLDAEVAMRHAADTAMVLFHDLACPSVAEGLGVLRNAGWHTMVYQTMQIMGVAWRGNIEPPEHFPDPNVFWTLPNHLCGYNVSNWKRPTLRSDGGWWPGMTIADRRNAAMMRAQAAEDMVTAYSAQVDMLSYQLAQRDAQIANLTTRLAAQFAEAARRDVELTHLGARLGAQQTEVMQCDAKIAELEASQQDLVNEYARLVSLLNQGGAEYARLVSDFEARVLAWESEDAALTQLTAFVTRKRVLLRLIRRSSANKRFNAIHARLAGGIPSLLREELLHWLLRRRTLFQLLCRSKLSGEAIITRVMARSLRTARTSSIGNFKQILQSSDSSFGDLNEFPQLVAVEEDSRMPLQHAGVGFEDLRTTLRQTAYALEEVRQSLTLVASHVLTLADHLLAAGWGSNAVFPTFFGRLLRQCFGGTVLGEEAELAWVKRIIRGWQIASDEDAIRTAAITVRNSGLFDASHYERSAGITGEWTDPAMHYVLVGDTLGLPPSEQFDPAYYGDRNPDVVAHGVNRLLHYFWNGRNEGRHPVPAVKLEVKSERIDAKRENIIIVVHEASRTGAPVLGWNIARHLAAHYNLFVVALHGGPLLKDFEALSAGILYPSERERLQLVDIEYSLAKLLASRSFKYAIINSCESRPAMQPLTRQLIPSVMLMHEFGSYVYPPDSLRAAFDMASEIVFPAKIVADSALEMHPSLSERPIRILPQGLCVLPEAMGASPTHSLSAVDALARARDDGAFIVVAAGTVDFRKGVDLFLITAMAVAQQVGSDRVKFLWVGGGYRPEVDMAYSVYLREQLERSELQHHVTFIEEASDLEPIYAIADAFLLASRLDPMPNVCIDAAYRGIPIVCFKNASGIADLLLSNPETSHGVVDYSDPFAASRVILSLAGDRERWTRTAIATQELGRAVFDMEKYVESIDALGTAAFVRAVRKHEDADLLSRTDDFDPDIFLGPEPVFESRAQTIRRAIAQAAIHGQSVVRRPAPGFNPKVWRQEHSNSSGVDPLAEFIRAGRPAGPWVTPVLRPAEDPAQLEAFSIKVLLHVHLLEIDRAANLLARIGKNRLRRFDLLVSTDTTVKAELLRSRLSAFESGAARVVVAQLQGTTTIEWLLSLLECSEWSNYEVFGHLHDDCTDEGDDFLEFQWTSLLGGRQRMFDRVLCAFASQSDLGLVFPSYPLLPGPEVTTDYPSGGMFWARRATLDRLRGGSLTYSMRALPQACRAAGLMQAVTHVPGVFW